MFRRRFLQLMTVVTAGGLAPLQGLASTAGKITIYRVKGFSCITCATGLDTMLSQQKGIMSSKSTYPEGIVTVTSEPDQITQKEIVAFIGDLGFTVEERSEAAQANSAKARAHK